MKKEYRINYEDEEICFSKIFNKAEVLLILVKASLIGLIGVSLCMANISGKVTDTSGVTPIAGAVVKLEKGGQMAIAGADGSFTLVVGDMGILPGNGKLLPKGMSARISGNMVNVTIAKKATVEIAVFDISGKSVFTVRKTLNAGSQNIALPQRGTGIYLYKVKAGDSELVLKENANYGVSYENWAMAQGSSSKSLSKQAKAVAKISDFITATKDENLNYRCVIGNSDTSGVVIKMIANAGNVIDVDGNVYQSVRIGNQVWMAENLRVTKYNDSTVIPLDTLKTTWDSPTTPKYCFYNNTTNSDSIKRYGALYNWHVVNPANARKIAPTGWHVPTDVEWDTLENYLIAKGYNWDGTTTGYKIAKALAAKSDWLTYSLTGTIGCDLAINNGSGFSAFPGGFRRDNGYFSSQSSNSYWWCTTEDRGRCLGHDLEKLERSCLSKSFGLSVRLVKD